MPHAAVCARQRRGCTAAGRCCAASESAAPCLAGPVRGARRGDLRCWQARAAVTGATWGARRGEPMCREGRLGVPGGATWGAGRGDLGRRD
eukprot:365263-Chlamydomonas_euryale.AAC.8